jgi:putative intracellular protease/amidase
MSLKSLNVANSARPKRIALILSNPAVATTTGWPVGLWWSELTHPYYEFTEAGYEVEPAKPMP